MRGLLQYCKIAPKRWHPYLAPVFTSMASNRLKSTAGIKWLWEANEDTRDFHRANIKGTRMGFLELTLNSEKVLEHKHFIQALKHLQRKTPHLRTCLRNRGLEESLWFCHPPNLDLDFQVLQEDAPVRDVILELIQGYEKPDAATFSTRLIPHQKDALCPIPEVKISHPYQYGFIFTGHHGIMDGLGASFVLKCLMEILNDVVAGRHIDDDEYGPIYEDQEIPALLNKIKEKFNRDPNFVESVARTLSPPDHTPLFFQAFPRPEVSKPTTKHITGILEPQILKNFQVKCKEEGVTFNSALVAVINTAVMELVRDEGIILDTYRIAACMLTTLRRYMKPSHNFYYGPCVTVMSYVSLVDNDVRKNFWGYCRNVNEELQSYMKQGIPLQQKALHELKVTNQPPLDYVTTIPPVLHDYGLTNYGDLTSLLPNEGNIVKVTSVASKNMIQNAFHSNFHEVLSFNGRNYYTLGYATNYFSDDSAKMFLDKIFSILKDFSQNNVG